MLPGLDLEGLLPNPNDNELEKNQYSPIDADSVTLTMGFNIHSKLFWAALTALAPRARAKECCLCVQKLDSSLRLSHLHELRYMLDDLPQQLRPWAAMEDDDFGGQLTDHELQVMRSQFETMRANIHVTHLWLQSIILDDLDALVHHQQTQLSSPASIATPSSVSYDPLVAWSEREDLCRQLLHVLHSIPEINLETNGLHLAYKVRDMAIALLTCPYAPASEPGQRAAQYLKELTGKLSKLDRSEALNSLSLQSWVDTERKTEDNRPEPPWI